jgi:3-hydroxyisobutyrate dehydrogenase-like beta-hydroxyacid dehydrogenase
MADVVGLLHPGEMGAAIGAVLRRRGMDVLWASEGRSAATRVRADAAGLRDAATVAALARDSDVILSVCPPHAAADVAASAAGFDGVFVDANAVSPEAARRIGGTLARFVDGGIVGGPPTNDDGPRLYVSGAEAEHVAALFAGTTVDARVLSGNVGEASALKMTYAAWTKGSARDLRGRARRGRVGRAGRGVAPLAARARAAARVGRALGRREGLALGRRDGRDRRDVRSVGRT